MSVQIDDVPQGLAPFHYAGFRKRPDAGALSTRPLRILIIGSMEGSTVPREVQKVSPEKLQDFYGDGEEESILSQMLKAAYRVSPYVPLYALAISPADEAVEGGFRERLRSLPEMSFSQIACSLRGDELSALNEEMEERWGSVRQIDGHVFVAEEGTADDVEERYKKRKDYRQLTIMPCSDSATPHFIWAAVLAATVAKYGHKPQLPYHGIELRGVKAPVTEFRLATRNQLLSKGFSTFRVEGERVVIDRLVTFWTKDRSYRDLSKKMLLSYLRYDFVNFLKETYPRHALSGDESQADGDVATPKSARDLAIARHIRWKQEKYVQDPENEFKKLVDVRIDPDDGESLIFYLPVRLMGQYRRSVVTIAFSL